MTPRCSECRHYAPGAEAIERYAQCVHPGAYGNRLPGCVATFCTIERGNLRAGCGPQGFLFAPIARPSILGRVLAWLRGLA